MTKRIVMWSGPRNISTAMMRSFENRDDCAVSDEPFYAAFLSETGLQHPMTEEVLASQPNDWRAVAADMVGNAPDGAAVWYQKHMCHHMVSGIGFDWMKDCTNAFLIRDPADVIASYIRKHDGIDLDAIGVAKQAEIFDRAAQILGAPPPVVDTADVLASPRGVLTALCDALTLPFSDKMLSWPAGKRDSDGVWAPAWYDVVEASTGFARPSPKRKELPAELQKIAGEARPHYESMARHRLVAR
ncbi:HAD family hydrolase [Altererythrobacter sp. ZODW24]|uniref:sulfotransferase-like domain-containing protein n=1 Tax=Altererythrobacter sp. ZODW24 TaxID=2185142 RepID=UPI000DF80FAF|nr:HAD family hydrolase [Altererythrobacter sp. ZODW24]